MSLPQLAAPHPLVSVGVGLVGGRGNFMETKYPTKTNSAGMVICAICTPFKHDEGLHQKVLDFKASTASEDVLDELDYWHGVFGEGYLRGDL